MAQKTGAPKKKTAAKKGAAQRKPQKTKAAIDRELTEKKRKRQSIAVIIFAFGILFTLMVLFRGISEQLHNVLCGIFGGTVCSLLWCVLTFYIAVLLALDDPESRISVKISQAIGVIMLFSIFFYCVTLADELRGDSFGNVVNSLWIEACNGRGPGEIGGIPGWLLVSFIGKPLTIVLVILVSFVLIMLLTKTGLIQLFRTVSEPVKKVSKKASDRAAERAVERAAVRAEKAKRFEIVEQTPSKRRHRFDIDVPIDDMPVAQEPKKRVSAKNHVLIEEQPADEDVGDIKPAKAGRKRKAEIVDISVQDEFPEVPEVTDEQSVAELEAIAEKALAKKTKKQKTAEIEKEAEKFEKEIAEAQTPVNEYVFPPIDLLEMPDKSKNTATTAELTETARKLVETLQEYHVDATVSDMSRGPAVTRYEVTPAAGVRINKIVTLTDDIALRLAAKAVRIEAPIPGKSAVGVEIPNRMRSVVSVRELIDSEQFRSAKSPITVSLGKDIEGNIVLTDLSKMPHLLIAGSTGMGKSVCINSILVSLLYKSSPEDVRLIMVDPKSVELDVYNGIPHLLVPVVCDPKKAAGALQWAVTEMLKRYALLKDHGVRNLDGYNKLAEKSDELEKLPRIVIIIDELADLMAASPKEVEDAIARLAAMARAAGMHIIIATQRPSVDVITGTIKNNIPSRIAFTVSSQVDSRTILGEGGAEKLIGKGDMLFNPVGASKPIRLQGCFVDDPEVERVVDFVKANSSASYDDEIAEQIERIAAENASSGTKTSAAADDDMSNEDPMFIKAIDVVIESGQASTSMLQRRLGVGYARAGRLIDQLAERGIIGPYAGSKPREVLMSRQQFLEMTMSRDDYAEIADVPGIDGAADMLDDDDDDDSPF